MNNFKDCKDCIHNGMQHIFQSRCTGCGDGEYLHFEDKDSNVAHSLLADVRELLTLIDAKENGANMIYFISKRIETQIKFQSIIERFRAHFR